MIIDSRQLLCGGWCGMVFPLIEKYRTQRGPDFWNDYEWLFKEAQAMTLFSTGTFKSMRPMPRTVRALQAGAPGSPFCCYRDDCGRIMIANWTLAAPTRKFLSSGSCP